MKLYALSLSIVLVFAQVTSCFAEKGSGHSGGGQGVLFQDGEVRLVDFLDQGSLPAGAVSEKFIYETFFKKNRYVKNFAKPDEQFFSRCSTEILKSSPYSTLQTLANYLPYVKVYRVNVRLVRVTTTVPALPVALFASKSPSLPEEFQEPLAAFNEGQVWIADRFYEAMSEKDQCGLSVHEALRYLNLTGFLTENLETAEIEAVTRYLVNRTPLSAELDLKLKQQMKPKLKIEIENFITRFNELKIPGIPTGRFVDRLVVLRDSDFSSQKNTANALITEREVLLAIENELQVSQPLSELEWQRHENLKDLCRDFYFFSLRVALDANGSDIHAKIPGFLAFGPVSIILDELLTSRYRTFRRLDAWTGRVR